MMKSNARLPVERVSYTLAWKGHLRIGCDGYFGQGLSGFRFTRGCTVESEREQRLELIRTISRHSRPFDERTFAPPAARTGPRYFSSSQIPRKTLGTENLVRWIFMLLILTAPIVRDNSHSCACRVAPRPELFRPR